MSITRIRKTRKVSEKARIVALVLAFGGLGFLASSQVEAASLLVVHKHGHAHPPARAYVVHPKVWRGPVRRPYRGRTVVVVAPRSAPRPAPLRRLAHAAVDAAFLLD